MSVIDGRAKLVQATKKLTADWQRVREAWRDENARQFEKKYMEPLESNIRTAVLAMERIGAALNNARYDCEDRG